MLDVLIGRIENYPAMLKRIAICSAALTLIAVHFLRKQISWLDHALAPFTIQIEIMKGVDVPLGTALPAAIVGVTSRVFQLHDRVSDVLGIRQRFDVNEILLPLAIVCCPRPLTSKELRSIKSNRQELMSQVFYKYASSSEGQSVIDVHAIHMALDHWSWYWAVLEGMLIGIAASVILACNDQWKPSALIGGGSLLLGYSLLRMMGQLCSREAEQQVRLITSDPARCSEIGNAFRAI